MSCMELIGHLKMVIHVTQLPVESENDERSWERARSEIIETAADLIDHLMSTPNGLRLIKHHASKMMAIKEIALLDDDDVASGMQLQAAVRLFNRRIGFCHGVLTCCQCLETITKTPLTSTASFESVQYLLQVTNFESGELAQK